MSLLSFFLPKCMSDDQVKGFDTWCLPTPVAATTASFDSAHAWREERHNVTAVQHFKGSLLGRLCSKVLAALLHYICLHGATRPPDMSCNICHGDCQQQQAMISGDCLRWLGKAAVVIAQQCNLQYAYCSKPASTGVCLLQACLYVKPQIDGVG